MSNDLVKRLRDYEEYEQSRDGQIICVKSDMAQEAATYIEQLEAENRELAMQVLASGSQAQEAYEAQLKTEAATAAAYEVAAEACADYPCTAPHEYEWARYDEQIEHSQLCIRSLATSDQTAALDKLIAEAKIDALAGPWDDKPDAMTPAVEASYPHITKDYKTWTQAMELVSARHSKGALVALVNHLLAASKKGGV